MMVDISEAPKSAGSKSGDSYEDRDCDPPNLGDCPHLASGFLVQYVLISS